ncbi:LapA family protein [Robertmurraya korlensis]|uniref:LapA family protein n=1 Tax=Robertmurraya korlensis TaxID=519977 RepID=UPI00082712DF|nr:lipopolysaccharide assembly protein LapA domain-containing protein [Robertmurraya korlensis]
MKFQWTMLLGILFALLVAIFAVINVEPVSVNYVFGSSEWPLVLVILVSVLMGGIIIGSVGLVKIYSLQRKVKQLTKEKEKLNQINGTEIEKESDLP